MTTSTHTPGFDPALLQHMAAQQTKAMKIRALLDAASALAGHPSEAEVLIHVIDGATKLARALDDELDTVVLNKLGRGTLA